VQKEASEVFFSVTKLYQSKDANLRRMVYLVIKVSVVSDGMHSQVCLRSGTEHEGMMQQPQLNTDRAAACSGMCGSKHPYREGHPE
jgi:hypothetical protein